MLTIIFFGPDASGKSTQVRLLTSFLRNHGLKTRKVWIRAHHSFVFLILKFFFKADLDRDPFLKESNVGPVLGKSKTWVFLEVVSVLPWVLFRFYLPRFLGYVVVCDRYIIDTVVSLAYTCGDGSFLGRFPSKVLFCFIPKDTLLIHCTGDTSSLKGRSKEGKVVKDSIDFQKEQYKKIAHRFKAKTLDTSVLSKEQTYTEVLSYIALSVQSDSSINHVFLP